MRLPTKGRDLASLRPDLAQEWDYELNELRPECYFPHSNTEVNWVCHKGHKFPAKINNRTNGTQCSFCSGKKPIPGETDFATVCSDLVKEWDPANKLRPSEVLPYSNKEVDWICPKGHKYPAKIYHRTEGRGCPFCAGLLPIAGETDLASRHPEIAKTWHPTLNEGRLPSEFTSHSHHEAWWVCEKGHAYPAKIYHRVRGTGCSVCDGKRIVPGINDLQKLAPNLANEFHKTKNGVRTANNTGLHYSKDVWWQCSKCGHEWEASPNNRAAGRGCPKCAHCCVDRDVNSLAVVNPALAKQWDFEGNYPLTPYDIAAFDNRDYKWVCEKGHRWEASPANRNNGKGCSFCGHKKPVVGENDLLTLHPALCHEWHPTKNDRAPSDYLPQSHERVWWTCPKGHEYMAQIDSRVNGSGCRQCMKQHTNKRHTI